MFCDSCFTYCYYIKKKFSTTQKMLMVIKTFIKRKCIDMKQGERFIFVRYFNVVHFLNVIIFGWTNFFWVVTISSGSIVNWFTKSSRFEGFTDNELIRSFSRSIQWVLLLLSVFIQQERKFLLVNKELKGKNLARKFRISDITHEVSSCSQHYVILWVKSDK